MLFRYLALITLAFLPPLAIAQQALTVDDDHLQMHKAGSAASAIYNVSAGAKLVIDAEKYTFKLPAQLQGKQVNSLQVVISQNQQYSVTWDPKSPKAILSSETMRPNTGSVPFTGFSSGQQLILAIGNMDGNAFNVVWVGMAHVK
jgi:hypothetical protein